MSLFQDKLLWDKADFNELERTLEEYSAAQDNGTYPVNLLCYVGGRVKEENTY
jgi:hypothetical protein